MRINLLAFTADRELLTSLSALNAGGVEIVTSPMSTIDEFRTITLQQRFDAALIDAADSGIPMVQTILNLSEQHPGMKILILAADEDTDNLQPEAIAYDRLLSRPFNPEQFISSLKELNLRPEDGSPGAVATVLETPAGQEEHEPSLIEIIDAAENEIALTSEQEEPPINPATEIDDADHKKALSDLRLSYCCVLVPRHPHQYLARELADHAAAILPQLHLKRGWRVTGISIRPQCLQWIISLPLETCPVDAIKEIRQQTSADFYETFPELAPASADGDFWAPGYLMMSGSHALSPVIIHEFCKRAHSMRRDD